MVDESLRQLEQSMGDAAQGQMGTQSLTGGDVGFDMPRPSSMFGAAGGIEAVEQKRDELDAPTPALAEQTLSDAARLNSLQNIDLANKSDSQLQQEHALMHKATNALRSIRALNNPSPLQQQQARAMEQMIGR